MCNFLKWVIFYTLGLGGEIHFVYKNNLIAGKEPSFLFSMWKLEIVLMECLGFAKDVLYCP